MGKTGPLKLSLKGAAQNLKDEMADRKKRLGVIPGRLGNMTKDEALKKWATANAIIPVSEGALTTVGGVMEKKDREITLVKAGAMREMDVFVQKCQEVFGDIIYEMEGELFCPVCMESVKSSENMSIPHTSECSLGALIELCDSNAYGVNPYREGSSMHDLWPSRLQKRGYTSTAGASQQTRQMQQNQGQYGTIQQRTQGSNQSQFAGSILSQEAYTQMLQQATVDKINKISTQECIERYGSKTIGGPKAEPEWKTALKSALDLIPTIKRDGES